MNTHIMLILYLLCFVGKTKFLQIRYGYYETDIWCGSTMNCYMRTFCSKQIEHVGDFQNKFSLLFPHYIRQWKIH